MAKVKSKKVCKAAQQVKEVVQNTQLQVAYHFPCPIYLIERPDFIESIAEVSNESLAKQHAERKLDEIYPVMMSGSFADDPRVKAFAEFVGGTAWNILSEQGYAMQDKVVTFTEMWTQEHHKHSAMEQHVHGFGAQIVGFYFLEVPENSSRVVFHDPRQGKVMSSLPEQDMNIATPASQMINFEPKPGLLIFSNSWLPHSFTRHANEKPLKFVHFNLIVNLAPQPVIQVTSAEII